jgi:hypothetical protein
VSDVAALYAVDPDGAVLRSIGDGLESLALRDGAHVTLDDDDHIFALVPETGRVFVRDVTGRALRTFFLGTRGPADADIRARVDEDDLRVFGMTHRAPRFGTAVIAQPGSDRAWEYDHGEVWLVGADGDLIARYEIEPGQVNVLPAPAIVGKDGSLAIEWDDVTILDASGALRAKVRRTNGASECAYDGARLAWLERDVLVVHDVASGSARRFRVAGEWRYISGDDEYSQVLLPRSHDEVWFFDRRHMIRRLALPRG